MVIGDVGGHAQLLGGLLEFEARQGQAGADHDGHAA